MAVMMTNVLNTQLGVTVDFALFTVFGIFGYGIFLICITICKFIYNLMSEIMERTYCENTEKLNSIRFGVLALLGIMVFAMFLPGFCQHNGLKTF